MFVALSYAKMNRVRAEQYQRGEGARATPGQLRQLPLHLPDGHPPGDNCFILEDNTIQPFVRIGNNVTLWSGNHIGHDSVIDDHCFITRTSSSPATCDWGQLLHRRERDHPQRCLARRVHSRRRRCGGHEDTTPRAVFAPSRTERFKKTSDQLDL